MNHRDEQAEWWALGALLEHDAAQLLTAHPVAPEVFTDPDRALAFRAIESFVSEGVQPRLEAVAARLRWGGGPRLAALMNASNSATQGPWDASRFGPVATRLRECLRARRYEAALDAQRKALGEGVDPLALAQGMDELRRDLEAGEVEEERTGADDLLALCDDWAEPDKRPTRIPTGIAVLDEHTGGGWVPNLNILAGQPGALKSGTAMLTAWNQARAGMSVGYIGLEEGTKFIARRLLASALGLSVRDVGRVRLNAYQQERLQEEAGRIYPVLQRLRVDAGANTPAKLGRLVRRWISQGVQCIYLDHGGEVEHDMVVKDRFDLAIRRTLLGLRPLLIRHNVPLVWICHLNREPGDGRPKKGHLKESGYLEAMGRLVLGCWRHERWPDRMLLEVMKGNETEPDCTLWLQANWKAALPESDGGGRIAWDELAEERREQQRGAAGGWRRGAANGGATPG